MNSARTLITRVVPSVPPVWGGVSFNADLSLVTNDDGSFHECVIYQDQNEISFHPEQLDGLIAVLTELRTIWRQSQSDLYREPPTGGEG